MSGKGWNVGAASSGTGQSGAEKAVLVRAQAGHGLALHVGAHQGAVGVVMLQEGNQTGRHADHLARGDVDVLDFFDRNRLEVSVIPGNDVFALEAVVFHHRVGRGQR